MSDYEKSSGFSFQMSDSPPPVESAERTPLGDLDLDLGAFGSPLDSPTNGSARALSHEPSAAPRAPSFVIDAPAPVAESPAPAPVKSRQAVSEPARKAPAPRESGAPVPEIKKIQFPKKQKPSRAEVARPPTRFSKSVGADGVRIRIDSEPPEADLDAVGSGLSQLAPPEDLPLSASPLPQPETWATDTPSAREIWLKARKTWQATSRQALAIGGHGLRAGKDLAGEVNRKLRERMQQAEEEKAARNELADLRARSAPEEMLSETAPKPRASAPGSASGKAILDLARTAGSKLIAPASALAACALVYLGGTQLLGAAPAVALSKTQSAEVPDLGTLENESDTEGRKGHAKSKAPGSESGDEQSAKGETESDAPSEMQTEVTEMPDGLSWPGKGLIEVVTSQDELIYVDGVFTGRGPLRRIPVAPGDHEVSIKADGKKRTGSVQVQLNKSTRAVFKG